MISAEERDRKHTFEDHCGGVFLVVADETEEFMLALRYAAIVSKLRGARLGILKVIEPQDFMHWGNIENQMRREHREKAEKFLWEIAGHVEDFGCEAPAFYIYEGSLLDTIMETVENDPSVKRLILATSAHPGNPGPLVKHFTSKALSKLRVPLLIVPGHIDAQTLEDLI